MTLTARLGSLFAALLASALLIPGSASAQDDDIGRNVEAICCGGSCCLIDTVCYATGEANPLDACEICDPSSNQTSFSMDPTCVDAGPGDTDAGPGGTDAGSIDAGPPAGTDAGPPAGTDAGPSSGTDAGPGGTMDAGPGEDDGGCSVGHGASATWPGLAVLALGLAFLRRRR